MKGQCATYTSTLPSTWIRAEVAAVFVLLLLWVVCGWVWLNVVGLGIRFREYSTAAPLCRYAAASRRDDCDGSHVAHHALVACTPRVLGCVWVNRVMWISMHRTGGALASAHLHMTRPWAALMEVPPLPPMPPFVLQRALYFCYPCSPHSNQLVGVDNVGSDRQRFLASDDVDYARNQRVIIVCRCG